MTKPLQRWARRYHAALDRHLHPGTRRADDSATRLGRQAVALGLQTLDLVRQHGRALAAVAANVTPVKPGNRGFLARAQVFFIEAITPMADGHRIAMESHAQCQAAKQALRLQTANLATVQARLREEVARREGVEESLRQSQQHSRELLERSRLMQEQLRHLSRQILLAQEEERKEISRELHDDIAQTLSGINVHLQALSEESISSAHGLRRRISSTQRLVAKSVNIVHRFARELRPTLLDDLGLIPALHSFMKEFVKRTGLRVRFTAFAGVERLNGVKRTVLYRVVQAALTNVEQHARAARVRVSIRKVAGDVAMEIVDDGRAFDVERVLFARGRKRLGLLGMRERMEMVGGTFAVESVPGRGTTIRALMPLAGHRKG